MDFDRLYFDAESIDSAASPNTGNIEGDQTGSDRQQTTTTRYRQGREPLEPLIVAALRSAPARRLLLSDIYSYIETHSSDYRDDAAAVQPSSMSTSTAPSATEDGRKKRTKEPAWKIHVRHILSVKRDVFPLTADKDGKRRGRYHALDEQRYAKRLASKTQRSAAVSVQPSYVSILGEPARRRQNRQNRRSCGEANKRTAREVGNRCTEVHSHLTSSSTVQCSQSSSSVTQGPPFQWQYEQRATVLQQPTLGTPLGYSATTTDDWLPNVVRPASTHKSLVAYQCSPSQRTGVARQQCEVSHHRTWGQVETNQSTCRHVYQPHLRQQVGPEIYEWHRPIQRHQMTSHEAASSVQPHHSAYRLPQQCQVQLVPGYSTGKQQVTHDDPVYRSNTAAQVTSQQQVTPFTACVSIEEQKTSGPLPLTYHPPWHQAFHDYGNVVPGYQQDHHHPQQHQQTSLLDTSLTASSPHDVSYLSCLNASYDDSCHSWWTV